MDPRLYEVVSSFVSCTHPQAARLRLIVTAESPATPKTGPNIEAWCSQCGSMQIGPDTWRATVGRAGLALAALDTVRRLDDELDLLDQAAVAARELARAIGEVASLCGSGDFTMGADTLRHLEAAALSMADGFDRLLRGRSPACAHDVHELAKAGAL
jgi:hypothetical protein